MSTATTAPSSSTATTGTSSSTVTTAATSTATRVLGIGEAPPPKTDAQKEAEYREKVKSAVLGSGDIADEIIKLQKAWGIPFFEGSQLVAFIVAMVMVFLLLVSWIFSFLGKFKTIFMGGITGNLHTFRDILFFLVMVSLLITLLTYYIYIKPAAEKGAYSLANAKSSTLAGLGAEGFQVGNGTTSVTPPEGLFQNLQPLAVKQAAYIGNKDGGERGGFFNVQDTESAIQNSLRMGIRAYTLQIDYLDSKKDPKKFEEPGRPTLVYRDDNGVLISDDGASIEAVAKQLATYAFNPDFRAYKQPIFLYLHFLRTPDAIRSPEDYLRFLSRVAEALQPLFQYHLNATPEGNFQRQSMEKVLLKTPLQVLEGKVVILSNADTSLFRSTSALGMKTYEVQNDLDYWINLRVYATNNRETGIGVATTAPDSVQPSAVIVPLQRLLSLDDRDKTAFARKGKEQYVIAMPGQLETPTKEHLKTALETLGVNWVPLNLFEPSMDALKAKLDLWNKEPMSKQKPLVLQSHSPMPRS